MLKFDAETTRLLDLAYEGADIARRRRASFDALHLKPGETILDIGCGNGMLTAELARAVGSEGQIIGIDPSDDMRKSALQRCLDFNWVDILSGAADNLPVDSGTIDKAVSIQVFEYLRDIPKATREALRVLKPGGLLVIADIHFDSLVWFSEQPERMAQMISAWDHHLVERCVPAMLPAILSDTGFAVEKIHPETICDINLKPDGLAKIMMTLMKRYAVENGYFSSESARQWSDEQLELAKAGQFFFSITHFVISARKK